MEILLEKNRELFGRTAGVICGPKLETLLKELNNESSIEFIEEFLEEIMIDFQEQSLE